jgi:ATP-dependent DNA helicase RecQ
MIAAALDGHDAFAVMPTGGGKSLCFQVPPLVDGGLTVVVSPLIALMKDQVDGLRLFGYPAEALNSNLSLGEAEEVRMNVVEGITKLLYISPEKLLTPDCLSLLNHANNGQGVKRIAIDEAHCISQWGHDFRPEYRQLSRLRQLFPNAPIHAFTATATPKVRDDVLAQLGLKGVKVMEGIFDRENLTYRIVPKDDSARQIQEAVQRFPDDAAIVYCISRKDTERVAEHLVRAGVKAVAYHAGLDPTSRRRISEQFAREEINVVVATVAFGMGIHRANVRCVIHESMPKSIEAYQQETGRAGRDGLPSECLMLYSPKDYLRWIKVIQEGGSTDYTRHQISLIDEVRTFAVGTRCRHAYLSEYFGQEYEKADCEACDLCIDGWQAVANSPKLAHQIIATVNMLAEKHPNLGFGGNHVAQILAGANTKQIRQYGHENLRAYGAMRAHGASTISTWVHQLVDLGMLDREGTQFPTVKVSSRGQAALRTKEEILLRDIPAPKTRSSRSPIGISATDEPLFRELKELRRKIAAEREVPAYVIFHDSVLMAMAAQRPQTKDALKQLSGVGERKAEDLGETFLEVIRKSAAPRVTGGSSSLARLRPLFEQGLSVAEMAGEVGLSTGTIEGYLAGWVQEECPGSIEPWVPSATYRRVCEVADRSDFEGKLRPLFDALDGEVPYVEIRISLAFRANQVAS